MASCLKQQLGRLKNSLEINVDLQNNLLSVFPPPYHFKSINAIQKLSKQMLL